jgi:hypothetical protein
MVARSRIRLVVLGGEGDGLPGLAGIPTNVWVVEYQAVLQTRQRRRDQVTRFERMRENVDGREDVG